MSPKIYRFYRLFFYTVLVLGLFLAVGTRASVQDNQALAEKDGGQINSALEGGSTPYCRFPNIAIPDGDPDGVTDSLVVGDSGTIQDLDVSIVATHTYVGDLRFTLTHQDTGTSVTFFDRPGVPASTYGCSGQDLDVGLNDEAALPVEDQCDPGTPTINGVFIPNNPLSAFEGEDVSGTWVLTAYDDANIFIGTLNDWCFYTVLSDAANLTIVKDASPADGTNFVFTSDLPDGSYLAQWGSSGSGAGQFYSPRGVAVDAAGNVYVADTNNDRIQKFSTNHFLLDDAAPDDGDGVTNTRTFSGLSTGTFMVTELLPDGWSLVDITCVGGDWTPNLDTQNLSITLAGGDDVTCTFTNSATTSGLIYVDDTATGANNGASWADAYTDLQDALAVAAPGAEIRVAAGLYLPGTDEMDTFQLKSGAVIVGSYPDGGGEPGERSFSHLTVLSGDLAGDDLAHSSGIVTDTANIVGDNAYHVVTGSGVDGSAVLDGFYITAGQADATWPENSGGGMFASNGSPFLQNIRFIGNHAIAGGGGVRLDAGSSPTMLWVYFDNNHADESGGGMFNVDSNPILINTAFTFNSAGNDGGGMTNLGSNPQVINNIFDGNAALNGGGMENNGSDPMLVNVTFVENHASDVGGALRNRNDSQVDILNSIFWNNSPEQSLNEDTSTGNFADSLIKDGCPLGSICIGMVLTSDPLFVRDPGPGPDGMWGTADDDFGDLHLTNKSPAIDAGNNIYLPSDDTDLDGDGNTTESLPYDFDYNPRVSNGKVDMGAYEWKAPVYNIYLPIVTR